MEKIKWIAAQPLMGGCAIGFERAFGYLPQAIITCGIPNDLHYINYMTKTRGCKIPIIYMDETYSIFKDKESELLYEKICKDVDVLQHVAICAGLSLLNTNNDCDSCKQRGNPDNIQNQNMYNLCILGFRMRAKVVVFENAPGAYTGMGEGVVNKLKEISSKNNYSMHMVKVNTLNHGIPQSRVRTFISFFKDTNPPYFEYENKSFKEIKDYLKEIPNEAKHQDIDIVVDGKDVYYEYLIENFKGKTLLEVIKNLFPEKTTMTSLLVIQFTGFDECIKWMERKYNETKEIKYERGLKTTTHCKKKVESGKRYWDCSTYIANDGKYINAVISKNIHRALHPIEERSFNIRELLWFMGMPHEFEMIEPKKNACMISQNVPSNTAQYCANQIKKYLNGELKISDSKFVKQDNINQKIDYPKTNKIKQINIDELF